MTDKTTDEHVEFHLHQAELYTKAIADPENTEFDSARKTAEHVAYHRAMADWYQAKPTPPEDHLAYTDNIERGDN